MEEKRVVKKRTTKKAESSHVVMVRDDGKEANVHPSEVENFKKGGYQVKG